MGTYIVRLGADVILVCTQLKSAQEKVFSLNGRLQMQRETLSQATAEREGT